jgi:hypothetical protein
MPQGVYSIVTWRVKSAHWVEARTTRRAYSRKFGSLQREVSNNIVSCANEGRQSSASDAGVQMC